MTQSAASVATAPTSVREEQDVSSFPQDNSVQTPAEDLQAVYNVPVKVQAVLGRTTMEVSKLLRLQPGQSIDLDRRAGEAVDIYVNDRLVARGEVVLIEDQ